MTKMKRVLRYLKGTTSIGLTYNGDAEKGDEFTAYVDTDHPVDMDKGYSTTGVVLFLAGAPVDWKSVKQTVVAVYSGIRVCGVVESVSDDNSP